MTQMNIEYTEELGNINIEKQDNFNSSSSETSPEDKIRDKRLYSIGDRTLHGVEIAGIYNSSENYIIYQSKGGSLCWEINKFPSFATEAISECRRLRGLAETYLNIRHLPKINGLLADSLATALASNKEIDLSSIFKESSTYIYKYKDEVTSIMGQGSDFVIYRTKNNTIQWYHKKLPEHLNKAVEEFESLHSLSNSILPNSYRPAVSRILGSALSVAFRKSDQDDIRETFSGARKFIFSQAESYLKITLFLSNILATTIFILYLAYLSITYNEINIYSFGSGAGALGAMISTLQRNNKISIDPHGSIIDLCSEVISRLIIGAIFGIFIIFCSKSELALAPFKDNIYAIICFSFASGFSERFVPDLMSKVTSKSDLNTN